LRRIWFAALLGIVLGLGLAAVPGATTSHERVFMQLNTAEAQPKLGATQTVSWQTLQPLLVALIAGIVLGMPLFIVAKRWSG